MTDNFNLLADHARVWIYAASASISPIHAAEIQNKLNAFTSSWTAHQNKLLASAQLFHNYFIVFMVDESAHEISGCGIDKSVGIVRELSEMTGMDFFNRLSIFLFINGTVVKTNKQEVAEKLNQGQIDENTLYFDNLVSDKISFTQSWLKPIRESWFFPSVLNTTK